MKTRLGEHVHQRFKETLAGYSEELQQAVASRAARFSRARKPRTPLEKIETAFASKTAFQKLVQSLSEDQAETLGVMARFPFVWWRWDHAVRLLTVCGIASPYRQLQSLLSEGLLCARRTFTNDPLMRFEIADGVDPELLPEIALSKELTSDQPFALGEPPQSAPGQDPWRHTDGWELPLRLALLWRLAWQAPIKRTQQNKLYKRDQERIGNSPLLSSPFLDSPELVRNAGVLTYELALRQDWLELRDEAQAPNRALESCWSDELVDILLDCSAGLLSIERWNELGEETPVGSFAREIVGARAFLLLQLSSLAPGQACPVSALVQRVAEHCPPFAPNGEHIGPLRYPEARAHLAERWVSACLLGPFYQLGLLDVDSSADHTHVRLSDLGRLFCGLTEQHPEFPTFDQTLLAQPNHEIIVYRQGLTTKLLCRLVQCAEPKSLGAALTFEINADSVYLGLEAGMTADDIVETLASHGGRELPSGLINSIHTWSGRRDQLTVYADCSLFEFTTPDDLEEAVNKGLQGARVTDRIVLVTGEQEKSFKRFRITASRDYRHPAAACVEVSDDGVQLDVDLSTSDLMLDAELRRFSKPGTSHTSGRQRFYITAESVIQAYDQGMRMDFFDNWFRLRTGAAPPASVVMLYRAAEGVSLTAHHRVVIDVGDPLMADGLLQHPDTSDFWEERLGPTALAVAQQRLSELGETLDRLGIDFDVKD